LTLRDHLLKRQASSPATRVKTIRYSWVKTHCGFWKRWLRRSKKYTRIFKEEFKTPQVHTRAFQKKWMITRAIQIPSNSLKKIPRKVTRSWVKLLNSAIIMICRVSRAATLPPWYSQMRELRRTECKRLRAIGHQRCRSPLIKIQGFQNLK